MQWFDAQLDQNILDGIYLFYVQVTKIEITNALPFYVTKTVLVRPK